MKADLVLMGKRIDMAPRAHRRTLVAILYVSLALAMAACWFADRWHTSAAYLNPAHHSVKPALSGGILLRRAHQAIQRKASPPEHRPAALSAARFACL